MDFCSMSFARYAASTDLPKPVVPVSQRTIFVSLEWSQSLNCGIVFIQIGWLEVCKSRFLFLSDWRTDRECDNQSSNSFSLRSFMRASSWAGNINKLKGDNLRTDLDLRGYVSKDRFCGTCLRSSSRTLGNLPRGQGTLRYQVR